MALSKEADDAFNCAIEAAYAMEVTGKRWGRTSKELELVSHIYYLRMEEYYELSGKKDNLHWQLRCQHEPWSQGCRVYDV